MQVSRFTSFQHDRSAVFERSFDNVAFSRPARHEPCPCCVRPIAARLSSFWQLLYLYLDSSRFPQPALHELCPCYVRPIAARLSSFWQLLYQNLFLMQKRELLMQFPLYLCYHWFAFFSATQNLDSSRFPQPARRELCPCCVRPIAARLSSFSFYLTRTFLPFTM